MGVMRDTFEQGRDVSSATLRADDRTHAVSAAEGGLVRLPDAQRTFRVLALIALTLFVLTQVSIALDQSSALLLRFDTGYEANVGTWFSSAMWLAAGGLACAIGGAGRRRQDSTANRWLLLGGLFTLLALDETGQLHEVTVGPLIDAVERFTGLAHGPARLIAVGCVGMVLVAFGAWLWPWMRSLPSALRWRLVFAGTVFVGGSVGLEVVSRLYETPYLSPFEELAEMLGVALLVMALLPYVRGVVARPPTEPADRAPAA